MIVQQSILFDKISTQFTSFFNYMHFFMGSDPAVWGLTPQCSISVVSPLEYDSNYTFRIFFINLFHTFFMGFDPENSYLFCL